MAKANSKIKPVHFNLDNPDDLELFNRANKISNFSKWVKDQLGNREFQSEIKKEDIRYIVNEILKEKSEYQPIEKEIIINKQEEKKVENTPKDEGLDSMMM